MTLGFKRHYHRIIFQSYNCHPERRLNCRENRILDSSLAQNKICHLLTTIWGKMKSEIVAVLLVAMLFNIGIAKAVRRLARNEPCQEPGFFPDTADCQKFYRCAEHPNSDGSVLLEKYEFQCPEGTIYDDSISTCNHVGSVENRPQNCVVNPPPPMGTEGEGDAQDSKSLKPIFLSYSTPVFSYIPISNYILRK